MNHCKWPACFALFLMAGHCAGEKLPLHGAIGVISPDGTVLTRADEPLMAEREWAVLPTDVRDATAIDLQAELAGAMEHFEAEFRVKPPIDFSSAKRAEFLKTKRAKMIAAIEPIMGAVANVEVKILDVNERSPLAISGSIGQMLIPGEKTSAARAAAYAGMKYYVSAAFPARSHIVLSAVDRAQIEKIKHDYQLTIAAINSEKKRAVRNEEGPLRKTYDAQKKRDASIKAVEAAAMERSPSHRIEWFTSDPATIELRRGQTIWKTLVVQRVVAFPTIISGPVIPIPGISRTSEDLADNVPLDGQIVCEFELTCKPAAGPTKSAPTTRPAATAASSR